MFGFYDTDRFPHAREPPEKLHADGNLHFCIKMVFVLRYDGDILTEAVQQYACHIIGTPEENDLILPAVHPEGLFCKGGQCKAFKSILPLTFFLCDGKVLHFVHSVMLDEVCLCIVGNEIISLIIPAQCPRADLIECPGRIIQQKFKEEVDQNNKREAKVAKKEYKILNDGYEGASVIVECGFLSNPEECELLGKEDYQNKIANTLVNAIDEYFK